jgi:two-component system, NtrC family, sensor kinase
MEHKKPTYEELEKQLAEAKRQIVTLSQKGTVISLRHNSTENKADKQLVDSETRYRRLFETAQDGILLLDAETGQITDVNPFLVSMLGYTHQEFLGKKLWEIGLFQDVVQSQESFKQLQQKGYVRYENLPLETKDHRKINVEFVSNVYDVDHKKVIQCNIRDITERKLVEQKLREKDTLFSSTFYKSPILMAITTLKEGRIIEVNDAYCRVTGYSREEFIGHTTLELNIWHNPQQRARAISELEEYGQVENTEVEMRTKSGEVRTLVFYMNKITYNQEPCLISVASDISEQKMAREALKESEEKYRDVVERANDGICIIQNALVKFANHRLAELWGGSPQELINTPFLNHVHPEAINKVNDYYKRRLAGEPIPSIYETSLRAKDGTKIETELNIGLINFDGKPAELVIVRDITLRKQVENALRESRNFSDSLLTNAPNQIIVINPDTSIRYVNPAFEEANGWTLAEVRGMKLPYPWWPEEWKQQFSDGFAAAMEQGTGQIELPVKKKNGEIYWITMKGSPIIKDGKVEYLLINSVDISARKKAEQALQESERKYRDLYDNAPVAFLSIGRDGLIQDCNKAAQQFLGYKAEELNGKPRTELYSGDFIVKVNALFERYKKGETIKDEEMLYLKKDGTTVYGLLSVSPILDASGQVVSSRSVIVDITERKQVMEALRESEERYRAVIDLGTQGGEAIVMSLNEKGIEGLHIFFNEAWPSLTGYTKNELQKMSFFDLIHPRDRELSISRYRKRLGGEPIPGLYEITIICKNGTEIPIEVTGAVSTYQGKPASVIYIRDITRRKKMQEQLMAQDRLSTIGELVAGVAHELNNPLTSVIGFSELLLQRELPDDIRKDIQFINEGSVRVSRIVKNLLTFARKQPQEKNPIDISDNIRKILEMRSYEQKVNNIQVDTRFQEGLPLVTANAYQLQQVFLNLVVNAEYFMTEAHHKGNLAISTEKVGDMIRIVFADDGPGIPPENLGKLFTPFFTTKEVGKGTGLGLSICHGIIAEHGGRIYASSEPGNGATFIIELPIRTKNNG